jgi:ABC-type branched-subunit amino acid transport system ATPase component/ABC-type branched-subunit amino acid transport system permease subunit
MNAPSISLRALAPSVIVATIGLAVCFAWSRESFQYGLTLVLIWAAVGGSWNLISGYGGQMAFGHAVFFGIGAYVSTLLMAYWHVSPALGVFPGIVIAVIAAVVIGWPTLKLGGVYFSLATLAFPLMFIPVLSYLHLHEVSMPFVRVGGAWYLQFEDPRSYSLAALGLLIASLLIVGTIERSKLGLSLLAIRDDEWAAEASGIDAHRTKLTAFAISAAIAAAAGTLYASLLLVVTPHSVFGLSVTVKSLMVSLVGGLATVWGPVIGAIILIPLGQYLLSQYGAVYPGIDNVVLGLFLMLVIVWAPEGIYWKARDMIAGNRRAPRTAGHVRSAAPLEYEPPAAAVQRSQSGEVVLTSQNLSKAFAGVAAVSDVSFNVCRGEILGIIGPNGAGKTTLMNLINGFVRPDSGRVLFGGVDCTGNAPWRMRRRSLGRTFQVPRMLMRRTVQQNVEIGAFHIVASVEEASRLAREALLQVGLLDQKDETLDALSTTQVRKLELARALVGKPRVLMLDEPLAGLVATDIKEFSALIRQLRAEGLTIIIIEHTMSAMVALVDRFIVLDQGMLLAEGLPDAVMANEKVIEAYLGKGWAQRA